MLLWGIPDMEPFVRAVIAAPGSSLPGAIADWIEERGWAQAWFKAAASVEPEFLLSVLRLPGRYELELATIQIDPDNPADRNRAIFAAGSYLGYTGTDGDRRGHVRLAGIPRINCFADSCDLSAEVMVSPEEGPALWYCRHCGRDGRVVDFTREPALWMWHHDRQAYYVGDDQFVTRRALERTGLRIDDVRRLGLTGRELMQHLIRVFGLGRTPR